MRRSRMVNRFVKILSWKKVGSEGPFSADRGWSIGPFSFDKCLMLLCCKVKSDAAKMAAFQVFLSAYNRTRWIRTCERQNGKSTHLHSIASHTHTHTHIYIANTISFFIILLLFLKVYLNSMLYLYYGSY